jgi:WD40 repeat-containing protein SMU1
MSNPKDTTSLSIPSSDVLSLIQHHLTECGLTQATKALQAEAGVGLRGLLPSAQSQLASNIQQGNWGPVLATLSQLTLGEHEDDEAHHAEVKNLLADLHELAILELGDVNELELAFATLKACRETLLGKTNPATRSSKDSESEGEVLLASIERRLHSVTALRSVRTSILSTNTLSSSSTAQQELSLLPPDYYGNGSSKQKRRKELAKRVKAHIPVAPSTRLISLLQQSIKWQVHSGEMPLIQNLWRSESDDEGEQESGKKRKRSEKTRGSNMKFDLVLGKVQSLPSSYPSSNQRSARTSMLSDAIPKDPYRTIKFSKKTYVTSAIFFTHIENLERRKYASPKGCSLVTGSSDGFIEIWDSESKFTKLRMDLIYQKNDDLMCHYAAEGATSSASPSILALCVNPDGTMLASGDFMGTICIWNIESGKCLITLPQVHAGAITSLDFSKDGEDSSRVLSCSQDGTCREFGLRSKRMLKEFRGHSSFVNVGRYAITTGGGSGGEEAESLLVITASADGTVRIWDGKSSEVKCVLNPVSLQSNISSLVTTPGSGERTGNIHTAMLLHSPSNTMLVIPRGPQAFLLDFVGNIRQTYNVDAGGSTSNGKDFVAGTISPSNKWFYAVTENGICFCFDVETGKVEKTISDFGVESLGGMEGVEISNILHHPNAAILAAYSSSNTQKRGLLTTWK